MARLEGFSSKASDTLKLMGWLQGKEFQVKLMMKCYALSESDTISAATVYTALDTLELEYRQTEGK